VAKSATLKRACGRRHEAIGSGDLDPRDELAFLLDRLDPGGELRDRTVGARDQVVGRPLSAWNALRNTSSSISGNIPIEPSALGESEGSPSDLIRRTNLGPSGETGYPS